MNHRDRIPRQGPRLRLIVNADDFGRTSDINAAVALGHDTGIVTSASLMVAAPAAGEAVKLAQERPGLAVGLHIVVLGGSPALPPEAIPHLVGADGRFRRQAFAAGARYTFSGAARDELVREMRAQFEAFRATGLELSHVDGHHHMHLHPTVFALLLPLAQEYGARGIRVSVADELMFSLRGDLAHVWLKLGWKTAFFFMAANARRLLRRRPVPAAGRVYGLMRTGQVTEAYLLQLFERLARQGDAAGAPAGGVAAHRDTAAAAAPPKSQAAEPRRAEAGAPLPLVELFCHPSLRKESSGLGPNPGDLAAVTSPAVLQSVKEKGFELTTYPAAYRSNAAT